jgi:hypothetical protein
MLWTQVSGSGDHEIGHCLSMSLGKDKNEETTQTKLPMQGEYVGTNLKHTWKFKTMINRQ